MRDTWSLVGRWAEGDAGPACTWTMVTAEGSSVPGTAHLFHTGCPTGRREEWWSRCFFPPRHPGPLSYLMVWYPVTWPIRAPFRPCFLGSLVKVFERWVRHSQSPPVNQPEHSQSAVPRGRRGHPGCPPRFLEASPEVTSFIPLAWLPCFVRALFIQF